MPEKYMEAANILPSERQLNWQKTELYAFCHFGMNTFTDKEWGDGTDSPELFNPSEFDAEQWVKAIKNGGFKGLILTCKHHDGFCLWQTDYTDYSVASSPFKDGKGDVVKEVSEACKKHKIKFGVYLSPWDRHEKTYGEGESYNDFYVGQLTELLTGYGDIFCVWLDGACGEGKNGKKQSYDWQRYYKTIRQLQPNAVISICGPDVRWVGNEAGVCRESEWSVVPSELAISEFTADKSQKNDDEKFRDKIKMELDLGSRKRIKNADKLIWYPAEVDVSIRPGWFYHRDEDYKLKSVERLMDIYFGSVGGNATLLLNVPPSNRGVIEDVDALLLDSFKRMRDRRFYSLVSENSTASGDCLDSEHQAVNILNDSDSYWQCKDGCEKPEIIIDFGEIRDFNSIVLQENIASGQQIENFEIYSGKKGKFKKIYKGTVIGYKRIIPFKKKITADSIKIKITSYRLKATLLKAEVYSSKG